MSEAEAETETPQSEFQLAQAAIERSLAAYAVGFDPDRAHADLVGPADLSFERADAISRLPIVMAIEGFFDLPHLPHMSLERAFVRALWPMTRQVPLRSLSAAELEEGGLYSPPILTSENAESLRAAGKMLRCDRKILPPRTRSAKEMKVLKEYWAQQAAQAAKEAAAAEGSSVTEETSFAEEDKAMAA